jgi:hypothetical protein
MHKHTLSASQRATATSTTRIAFASFISTAIEFYDFYIYGLAVAMVIGPTSFPTAIRQGRR